MAGQVTWKSRGYGATGGNVTPNDGQREFLVNPAIERNMDYEMRYRSALGRLSKPVGKRTFKDGGKMRDIDVSKSAAVVTKEISSGDEVRFTLTQNIDGTPTYGDAPVQTGDYLSYLHDRVYVNAIHTPALPLMEEMGKLRVAEILGAGAEESEIRTQLELYGAEEYTYEGYRGMFRGASQALTLPEADGGIAFNMGMGAGVSRSIENLLIMGDGSNSTGEIAQPVSNSSANLAAYENRIADSLTAASAHLAGLADVKARLAYSGPRLGAVQDVREWLTSKKVRPVNEDSANKYYAMCDPDVFRGLTRKGGDLYEAWLYARERNKENPVFGYDYIDLDGLCFVKDPYLKKFRPTYTTGGATDTVAWGSASKNMRNVAIPSGAAWAPMLILGERALLEATSGRVKTTTWDGKHDQGREIASHWKNGFKRAVWEAKDGRTSPVLNQGSALVLFYTPNTVFLPNA